MTELPRDWETKYLGDIAQWSSGGTPKAGTATYYDGSIPWAVIGDLNDSVVHSTVGSITELGLANSSAKIVPAGTVLVAMYGSIGKLGIAGTPMATNQAIAAAQPLPGVNGRYLFYYLLSQRTALGRAGKGAAQRNIGQGILKTWPVPIPQPTKQRRIVELLDDKLSHLNAAAASLDQAQRRSRALVKSVLLKAIPEPWSYPSHWEASTVDGAGYLELGRQRHPDWHTGPNMKPYLRVANVFEDRIDTSDLMEMHWPEETFERFRLHPGDVLLNEGQSPQWLGRPAIYRGVPEEIAFTNSLLRFQADEKVIPEFALIVFRRHMHAGRFTRESRITTNIAHLSARRLKTVEFPIPPIAEQQEIVALVDEGLAAISRLAEAARAAQRREGGLRRAVLAAAFSGRLTGAASDTEVIEETEESFAAEAGRDVVGQSELEGALW